MQTELVQRFLIHTAQAIGGATTATAIDLPALLKDGRLDVDSFAQLLAGVIVQTGTLALSNWLARRRARRAKQPEPVFRPQI